MANIGNLAWVLSANPAPLQKGLDAAKGSLASFAQAAGKVTVANLASGIKGAATGISAVISRSLIDPVGMATSIANAVPMVGPLLALPLEGIAGSLAIFSTGAERIKEIGAASVRTGMDIQSMQLLLHSAGGSSEAMEKALLKLNESIGKAQLGAAEQSAAFRRLGLDAGAMAKMTGTARFEAVGQAIRRLSDPTLRAAASISVLGESAKDIQKPLMEGLDKARREMQQFGLGFTEGDLANVKAADVAKKQLGMLSAGLANQATLGIGAVLAELSSKLGGLSVSVRGFANTVVTMIQYASYGILPFVMMWDGVKVAIAATDFAFHASMAGWGSVFMVVLDYIDQMVKMWAKAIAFISKFNPAMKVAMKVGGVTGEDLTRISEEGVGGKAKGNIAAGVGDLMKKADEAKKKLDAATDAGKATVGQRVSAVNTFFDGVRARMAGVTSATQQGADAWSNYFKNLEAFREIQKSYGGPVEQFGLTVQDLNDKWARGAFMGRADLYNAALVKAYGEMEKTALPPVKAPAAILEGSKEAYSAVLAFQREGQQGSVQEQMKAILEQQKQVQQQQAVTSKEILEAMRALQRR